MNPTIKKALRRAAQAAKRELKKAQRATAKANAREFKDRVAAMMRAARQGKAATGLQNTPGAKALDTARAAVKEAQSKLDSIEKLLPSPKPRKAGKRK